MRFCRAIFYFITILTIGEVTTLFSQYRQEVGICFSSDWMESPLEEDESREYEDSDDFFCDSEAHAPLQILLAESIAPSLLIDPSQAFKDIIVPPPQG